MDAGSSDAETELPVQKQLEAYNARDIDAFMQCWADDCQYYEFPSRLPAFQGRGHGRRLLAHAETVAASLGLPAMRLYTNTLFAENVQLYRRLGYRVDREGPFKGSFTVYMSKPLGSPPSQHMHGQGG